MAPDHGGRGLGARGDPQLGEDVGQVHLDGLVRHMQPLGDAPVGQALADERGDLLFPAGQRGQRGAARPVAGPRLPRAASAAALTSAARAASRTMPASFRASRAAAA